LWPNPRNWRLNTAIAALTVFVINVPIAIYSFNNEVDEYDDF
jgi:hypothetical protein